MKDRVSDRDLTLLIPNNFFCRSTYIIHIILLFIKYKNYDFEAHNYRYSNKKRKKVNQGKIGFV